MPLESLNACDHYFWMHLIVVDSGGYFKTQNFSKLICICFAAIVITYCKFETPSARSDLSTYLVRFL